MLARCFQGFSVHEKREKGEGGHGKVSRNDSQKEDQIWARISNCVRNEEWLYYLLMFPSMKILPGCLCF